MIRTFSLMFNGSGSDTGTHELASRRGMPGVTGAHPASRVHDLSAAISIRCTGRFQVVLGNEPEHVQTGTAVCMCCGLQGRGSERQ